MKNMAPEGMLCAGDSNPDNNITKLTAHSTKRRVAKQLHLLPPKRLVSQRQSLRPRNTTYQYKRLNQGKNEIRLLDLLPGQFSDQIRVVIRNTSFDPTHPPVYEALSYVWGSTNNPASIAASKRGNTRINVTQNLVEALPYLRYIDRPRRLWIDAICIDQMNLAERSEQVQRMGDIFSLADRVIAWIGPEADNSSIALKTFMFITARIQVDRFTKRLGPVTSNEEDKMWADETLELPLSRRELLAISALVLRPWFGRLWVQQEVQLANSSTILVCGSTHCPWEAFGISVAALALKPIPDWFALAPAISEYHKRLNILWTFCRTTIEPTVSEFQARIYETQDTTCSDPRDRIYALMGIHSRNVQRLYIHPDYGSLVGDVFRNATLQMMKNSGFVNVLSSCELREDLTLTSPSWVPNFSIPRLTMPLQFALACGHSLPCWKFPVCDILHVTGRHIDRLDSIQDTSTFCQYGPLDGIFRSIKNLKLPKHLNEPYAGSNTMTVFDAYYDSLIGGEGVEQMIPPYRLFSYHSSKEILREVLNGEDNYNELREKYKDLDRYFDSVYYHCENRTLFTTEQGYVGIGPKFARAGDQICTFLGCASCMVLRLASHGRWQIVGECYVSGFMAGEAFLGTLPVDYRCIEFLERESGFKQHGYLNVKTRKYQMEDPRFDISEYPEVGSLVEGEWWHAQQNRLEVNAWNIHNKSDRTQWLWRPENLRKRGVELEWIDLV